ncbi:T9SS type A sorting domain-containing protein [Rosettibacter firmus]|uniref:T9SS type A sorting domain-containing protein n=1 Tax=Rosettibacter firmus TaxID=3111522 RepID=UPI00336BCBF8
MKNNILIIMFLLTMPLIAQNYEWQVLVGWDMEYPVSGGQVVYDSTSSKFYVLGGEDASKEVVDWIQEYNILDGKWKIVGKMMQPRYLFVANMWKSQILYFGGVSELSENKNVMETWNLKTIPSEPVVFDTQDNFARAFSTGYIKNNLLYIIGGEPIPSGPSELPYIVGYDLNNKSISFTYGTTSQNQPKQQMSILLNNNIYIFGGILNGALSSISKFDISKNVFEVLSQKLLTPRAGGVAIYNPILKRGFIIGGFNETDKALNSVEAIDFLSDGKVLIYPFASLKYARRNPMAINYGNTIVVFGGRDENGNIVPYLEKLVTPTGMSDLNEIPINDNLLQNYPNPFNLSTKIIFELSRNSNVSLDIFSLLGEHVLTLKKGYFNAGRYEVDWNGKDKFGNIVPAGVYFVQLKTDRLIQTRKMVLLK